jgi:ABC-type lipoprotein export system ATPase subunit
VKPDPLLHERSAARRPAREATHQPLLELRHVSRTFEVGETTVVALDNVSLTIGAAEMVAIQGPSGSGKSTLLQIVGLLDRPTEGSVFLDGQDLGELSDAEQTRLRLTTLGFVFQRFHLFNDLTAIENVELPMEAAGVPSLERRARAAQLLTAVGLGERMEFRPARLSGGQRQRVAIARALANNPRIILALRRQGPRAGLVPPVPRRREGDCDGHT